MALYAPQYAPARSGVLSTAMSFLELYRDPMVAHVTRTCEWHIANLVDAKRPASLYLVIPPRLGKRGTSSIPPLRHNGDMGEEIVRKMAHPGGFEPPTS